MCRTYPLTPDYVHIKLSGTNFRSRKTLDAASTFRLNQKTSSTLLQTNLQTFYAHNFMSLKIHVFFICALLMFSNSLKIIKIDGNMSEIWQTVCKKSIIWTLGHLSVLLCELFIHAWTRITVILPLNLDIEIVNVGSGSCFKKLGMYCTPTL